MIVRHKIVHGAHYLHFNERVRVYTEEEYRGVALWLKIKIVLNI
jgi:hypothetical protein